jgi:hypothetical protein
MVVAAGAFLDAADHSPGVGVGVPVYIFKAAAESVTSSTTMQDDNDLQFTIVANQRYEFDFNLNVSGSSSGDIRTQWAVPASSSGLKWCQGPANAGDTAGSTTGASTGWVARDDTNMRTSCHGHTTSLSYHLETNGSAVREWGWIESTVGGLVKLQWAQQVSNATATTMGATSYLRVTRIS